MGHLHTVVWSAMELPMALISVPFLWRGDICHKHGQPYRSFQNKIESMLLGNPIWAPHTTLWEWKFHMSNSFWHFCVYSVRFRARLNPWAWEIPYELRAPNCCWYSRFACFFTSQFSLVKESSVSLSPSLPRSVHVISEKWSLSRILEKDGRMYKWREE